MLSCNSKTQERVETTPEVQQEDTALPYVFKALPLRVRCFGAFYRCTVPWKSITAATTERITTISWKAVEGVDCH